MTEAPSLGRLLVLRTFSKAWGLAGLRVGYAVGSVQLVRAVRQSNGPYKVNTLAELAASVALAEDASWMRARAADAVAMRERVAQALRCMGFAPLDSRGNFVCVPVPDARTLVGRLAERGVAVRAFTGLPVFGDVLRVGMGPWPLMEQFLGALREGLVQ
jgi:histidinol-phosphate/aromatic aminotransferase/cobyric acid decarboxylase-like protein